MNPLGDFYMGDEFRVFGIFDIEDGSAVRRIHVTDVSIAVLDHHLAAAENIDTPNLFNILPDAKLRQVFLAHGLSPVL
jgi:hypothetical protein